MKKKGGRPGAEEWDHVTKLEGQRVRCNYCGLEFAASASRIKFHINKDKGKGIRVCTRSPRPNKIGSREAEADGIQLILPHTQSTDQSTNLGSRQRKITMDTLFKDKPIYSTDIFQQNPGGPLYSEPYEFPWTDKDGRCAAEETDPPRGSKKKVKNTEDEAREEGGEGYAGSFSVMLKGISVTETEERHDEKTMQKDKLKEGITIIEHKRGNDLIPEFILSKEVVDHICKPFALSLIVKLLGWTLDLSEMKEKLQGMWEKEGVFSVVDIRNNFFVATFSNKADYDSVLVGGPWMIEDHYLTVREWRRNFDSMKETIYEEVIVWARLNGLPLEGFNETILTAIGDRIGKTVKVDTSKSQENYARLGVQVNLRKPLLPCIIFEKKEYGIEYEGQLCHGCGRYGHEERECKDKVVGDGDERLDQGGELHA